MKYTQKEKQQIDSILTAFDPYIKSHPDFDILYSEKIGYVKIDIHFFEEYPTFIHTADKLLDILLHEVMLQVVYSPEFPSHMDNDLSELEKAAIRRYFSTLLETLKIEDEKKPFYIDRMEWLIEHDFTTEDDYENQEEQ